jgi:hypothetical protein
MGSCSVQMSDAHGSAGALGSFLHDPFCESDDLLFPERLAYPESVGVCSDLGPDSPSLVSSLLPHQALPETLHTHIDNDTVKASACLFGCASATKEPENGTAEVSLQLAASEPTDTGAAQRLLDLPTAAETKMQKLREKNRRNQLACRRRLKVNLPIQPFNVCVLHCQSATITPATAHWQRNCVARLHLLVTLNSVES